MKCPNCKKEIENGSTFCEHCGTRIKKSKKGLWITLSVVFVAIITMFIFNASQIKSGYVDLGLPSGTLWKNTNEGGKYAYYTYDEAVSRFGNKLPTRQQLEELRSKCRWIWTGRGYKVKGPNGNSIYLPAAGYRENYDQRNYGVDYIGAYYSSTGDSNFAYCLYFFTRSDLEVRHFMAECGLSVRLVQ